MLKIMSICVTVPKLFSQWRKIPMYWLPRLPSLMGKKKMLNVLNTSMSHGDCKQRGKFILAQTHCLLKTMEEYLPISTMNLSKLFHTTATCRDKAEYSTRWSLRDCSFSKFRKHFCSKRKPLLVVLRHYFRAPRKLYCAHQQAATNYLMAV